MPSSQKRRQPVFELSVQQAYTVVKIEEHRDNSRSSDDMVGAVRESTENS